MSIELTQEACRDGVRVALLLLSAWVGGDATYLGESDGVLNATLAGLGLSDDQTALLAHRQAHVLWGTMFVAGTLLAELEVRSEDELDRQDLFRRVEELADSYFAGEDPAGSDADR